MLIRTHMHDLKDITSDSHYENYRAQCIQNMTRCVCMRMIIRSMIIIILNELGGGAKMTYMGKCFTKEAKN